MVVLFSFAAVSNRIIEPEEGTASSSVNVNADVNASGGNYVQFNTPTSGNVTEITPGAETNYDKIPYVPPTSGNIVAANADPNDILTKANAAQPGDIIEVNDGTFNIGSSLTFTASGTATNPIIVRAKNRHSTIITTSTAQAIRMQGNFMVFQGFKFTNTSYWIFSVEADDAPTRQGFNNVIYDNYFDTSGDGQSASLASLIYNTTVDGVNPSDKSQNFLRTHTMIEKNQFYHPRNAPLNNAGAAADTVVSHNIFTGPHQISPNEREGIKFFCCEENPKRNDYNFFVQFNSVYNWGVSAPYFSEFKRGGATSAYNKFVVTQTPNDKTGMSSRYDNNKFIGNLMIGPNASIFLHSGNQTLKYNKIFAAGNSGEPIIKLSGDGQYSSTSPYTTAVANFTDNVIYNSGSEYLISNNFFDTVIAAGSTFTNNTFLRGDNTNWIGGSKFNANNHTWTGNLFHCLSGCADGSINAGITLGTNGNRAGNTPVVYNPTDANQTTTYDSQYTSPVGNALH